MRKNKKGQWIATGPLDLIGWSIRINAMIENDPPIFIIHAVSNDKLHVREVLATIEAIPVQTLERFQRGEQ